MSLRIESDVLGAKHVHVMDGDQVIFEGHDNEAQFVLHGQQWAMAHIDTIVPADRHATTNQRLRALGLRRDSTRIIDCRVCIGEMNAFEASAFCVGAEWVMRKRKEATA